MTTMDSPNSNSNSNSSKTPSMNTTSKTDNEDEVIWRDLKTWILQTMGGGQVHPSLVLQSTNTKYRGVYATQAIPKGETLVCLPAALALDGQKMPEEYKTTAAKPQKKRRASPWLRCLAAFYQYRANLSEDEEDNSSSSSSAAAYNASLPTKYETLWQWSDAEIENYLAGTSSPGGGEWNADPKMVKERYSEQVRPYLEHLKIVLPECHDEEYQQFAYACQTMSTRCFHLSSSSSSSSANNNNNNETPAETASAPSNTNDDDDYYEYTGPFFLPVIDLLNHSPDPAIICTTLERNSEFFVMKAERDIAAGEEILHSYGKHLTASQCFHTFGFVPTAVSQAAVAAADAASAVVSSKATTKTQPSLTSISPAVMTQQAVLDACYEVLRSDHPSRLAKSMQEQELEDEIWTIPSDQKTRDASFLPDVVVIREKEALPNELITLSCLPFLPICAYREAARALLDHSILEDYYLGKLVCASLLKALQHKLETYTPIRYQGSVVAKDDATFLKTLLLQEEEEQASPDMTCRRRRRRRVICALTVRLEEKASLQALRQEVVNILARLDESTEEEVAAHRNGASPTSKSSAAASPQADLSKRQRME